MDEQQIKSLIQKCREAKKASYSPYSKFPVGAALVTEDGTVFTGCNVENAVYPLGICAERVAIVKAVSEGHRKFKAIAISSDLEDPISPCGSCRQTLIEFGLDIETFLTRSDGTYVRTTPTELLPMGFTVLNLNGQKDLVNSTK